MYKCMGMQAFLTIILQGNVICDLEEIESSLIDLLMLLSLFPFLTAALVAKKQQQQQNPAENNIISTMRHWTNFFFSG